jgi:hypothetical protein
VCGGGGGGECSPSISKTPEKETSTRFAQKFIVQSSLLLLQLPLLLWLEDAPDGSINHSHLKMKIATTTSSATTTHAATNQQKTNLLLLRIHLPPQLFDLVLMARLMKTMNSINIT